MTDGRAVDCMTGWLCTRAIMCAPMAGVVGDLGGRLIGRFVACVIGYMVDRVCVLYVGCAMVQVVCVVRDLV